LLLLLLLMLLILLLLVGSLVVRHNSWRQESESEPTREGRYWNKYAGPHCDSMREPTQTKSRASYTNPPPYVALVTAPPTGGPVAIPNVLTTAACLFCQSFFCGLFTSFDDALVLFR
jgi:hypothetical protein